MKYRNDGSIQSSNTPTYENTRQPEDYGMYRCMVTKVIYTDEQENITANADNPRVLYDVVILGGFSAGQIISNCRLSSLLGGNFNYYERVLRPASKKIRETRLSDQDGDIVFVQFVQGHPAYPIITALDTGIQPNGRTGAEISDGARLQSEYNGVFEEINKNGEWCFTRKGGTLQDGVFVPAEDPNFEAEFKFIDNEMIWRDPKTEFKIKKNEEVHTRTYQSGLKVTEDGANDKITRVTKGGLQIEEDGSSDKVTITTSGGAKIMIDGSGNNIEIQDNGTGKLRISGDKVALGASSAELLQQISDQLDALNTLFSTVSSHTHVGNLGYPTAPPDTAGDWSSAASTMSTIKGLIDGIKGTL